MEHLGFTKDEVASQNTWSSRIALAHAYICTRVLHSTCIIAQPLWLHVKLITVWSSRMPHLLLQRPFSATNHRPLLPRQIAIQCSHQTEAVFLPDPEVTIYAL